MHCGFHGMPLIFTILGGLLAARLIAGFLRRRTFRGGHHWRFGPFGGGRSGWRSRGLRRVFRRLGTTVSQEKAIKEAIAELETSARTAKDEARAARGKLGEAFTRGAWSEVEEQGFDADVDAVTNRMKAATKRALRAIFDVLDDEQKKIVGQWIERRGGFGRSFGDGGPYRTVG